ncbi:MAG: hypothetical protein N2745_08010 [Syntrophorhabdaceae bacterium]|nr:hypothetical protein [Syntrophorhabdaceae bacterium]
MIKIALIDIDNTLWDFASMLYEKLKERNSFVLSPDMWTDWFFWRDFMSDEDFYAAIRGVHLEQDKYGVYPDARDFLRFLKGLNYHIIIASHRDRDTRGPTERWLDKHGLIYDELHLSYDKTVLFDKCSLIIDDSPFVLEKAKEKNIAAFGINHPWNRGNGFILFDSLSEIKGFIEHHI